MLQAVDQQPHDAASHLRMLLQATQEVIAPKRVDDRLLQSYGVGRTEVAVEESRFTEALVRAIDIQGDLVACLAEREDTHLAGLDQVEALRGAAFVEKDHVLRENAPAQAISQRVYAARSNSSRPGPCGVSIELVKLISCCTRLLRISSRHRLPRYRQAVSADS